MALVRKVKAQLGYLAKINGCFRIKRYRDMSLSTTATHNEVSAKREKQILNPQTINKTRQP